MKAARLLVADDDPAVRASIRRVLEQLDYEVEEASSCREAERVLQQHVVDAAILDYALGDGTALDILPRFLSREPRVPVVTLTGHGSIELAVRCIQMGADHFLTKPVDLPALSSVVARLVEIGRSERHRVAHETQRRHRIDPFVGRSEAIQELERQARRIAASDVTVLLQGETGSGKGILARWLHEASSRAREPLMELNCAALARDLLESELFGHRKGAFTGATEDKAGLLEVAHRGTVLLDEVGDMDVQVQPKLLKVLEDKRVRRVGEVADRSIDVRIVAATHQDLAEAVKEQRFRSDLYFRISTITLTVPPLRARPEDIPELAAQVLDSLATEVGRLSLELRPEAVERLQVYRWPGNIRELRNVLERAVLLSDSPVLDVDDVVFESRDSAEPADSVELTLADVEQRHIERVLRVFGGRVADAARRLDVPRSTLYDHIRRHGIDLSRFRNSR